MFNPEQLTMHLISGLFLGFLTGRTYASWLDFGIPPSNATVDVRVFNVANGTVVNDAHTLFLPVLPGHESAIFPIFSFLVEHKNSQKRLMFDLGIRTDPLNFAPSVAALFSGGVITLDPFKDITDLLQDGGIPLSTIDSVIWR
jgi:hypothetical protein